MAILSWEFEKGGYIALGLHLLPQKYCEEKGMIPDKDGKIHHIGEQEGVEDQMDALHFKKIEMADSIYIVNIGGYIGKSTAREIKYAEYLGKSISYFEPKNLDHKCWIDAEKAGKSLRDLMLKIAESN